MTETTHSHILNRDTITQYLKEECHFSDDEIANMPGKIITHAIINKTLDEFMEADIDTFVTVPALEEGKPFIDPNFDKYIEKYPDKWKIIKRVMPVVRNLCNEVEYNGKNALEAIDIIAKQTTCTYEDMLFFFDDPRLVREKYFEYKAYDLKNKNHELKERIADIENKELIITQKVATNYAKQEAELIKEAQNYEVERFFVKRTSNEIFQFDTDNFKDLRLSSKEVQIYLKFINSRELALFSYSLPLSDDKKVEELKSATSDKDIRELLDSGKLADANVCFNYQLYNFIYNDLDEHLALFSNTAFVGKTIKQLSPIISKKIVSHLKVYQLTALQKVTSSLNDTSNYLFALLKVLDVLNYFFTHFDDYSYTNFAKFISDDDLEEQTDSFAEELDLSPEVEGEYGDIEEILYDLNLRSDHAKAEAFYFSPDNFEDLELSPKKVQIYLKFLNSEELSSFHYLLPLSDEKKVEELKSATSDKDIRELLDSGELADANVCFNYQLYNFIYNDLDDSGVCWGSHLPDALCDTRSFFNIDKIPEQLSLIIISSIINNLKSYQLTALQKVMHFFNNISSSLNKIFNVLNALDYFFAHFDDYSCDNYENPFCMDYPNDENSDDGDSDLPF